MSAANPERVLGRVGLVGDVHAEDVTLARVLDEFKKLGVPDVLCVGDLADGMGDVNRCCALLEDNQVLTVIGNHDRWLLSGEKREEKEATHVRAPTPRSRKFIDTLPTTRVFDTPRGRLLLCHGVGDDDMATVKRDHLRHDLERNDALKRVLANHRYDLMVNGHTHQTMVRRVRHLTIINAGTLHRRYEPRAGIADFERGLVTFYEVGERGFAPVEELPLPEVDEWSRT
jgi:predicted phosphodiesterase